jgi:hypothetical protein
MLHYNYNVNYNSTISVNSSKLLNGKFHGNVYTKYISYNLNRPKSLRAKLLLREHGLNLIPLEVIGLTSLPVSKSTVLKFRYQLQELPV